jgi:hypothetical protein
LYYQNALVKPESFIQTLFSKTVEKVYFSLISPQEKQSNPGRFLVRLKK